MKKYTVGLMFSHDQKRVALVRKNRPAWQNGLLNGVGGKIEEGESSIDCMIREFREETGFNQEEWTHVITWKGPDYFVDFYRCFGDLSQLKTTTDEEIEIHIVNKTLENNVINNLRWIIPLCLDPDVEFGFSISEPPF